MNYYIRGEITDSNGERIPFANIYLATVNAGKITPLTQYGSTQTNDNGLFVFSVPPDRVYNFNDEFEPIFFVVSHITYERKILNPYFYVFQATAQEANDFAYNNNGRDYNGILTPIATVLDEVIVEGHKKKSFPYWLLLLLFLPKKKKRG
jgi:hypothetical protein